MLTLGLVGLGLTECFCELLWEAPLRFNHSLLKDESMVRQLSQLQAHFEKKRS